MSTAPNPKVSHGRPDESRRSKGVPKAVITLGILCAGILILIPISKQEGWFQRKVARDRPPNTTTTAVAVYPQGLEIQEARFDPASRTIKGIVKNTSSQIYQDVQVSYVVRDRTGVEAGVVIASVTQLRPRESAPFATNPFD